MLKAVFLDRDGTIIRERGDYNYLPDHLDINDGAVEALRLLKNENIQLFVVTNQGGIAKGIYQHSHVKEMHKLIKNFFNSYGILIKDFFYCPHHPDYGNCLCRKPNSLMLEKAMALHKIQSGEALMIGDSKRDVEAAENAGIDGMLIEPNENLFEVLMKNKDRWKTD